MALESTAVHIALYANRQHFEEDAFSAAFVGIYLTLN